MKCIFVVSLTFMAMLNAYASDMQGRQLVKTSGAGSPDAQLVKMGGAGLPDAQLVQGDVDFSDCAMSKVKETIYCGNDNYVQFEGLIRTMGTDPSLMPNVKKYLKDAMANYRPGMQFNAAPEIEISSADKINQGYLAQFIIEQLMQKYVDHREMPSVLEEYKKTDQKPFNYHSINDNNLLFALMYYVDNKDAKPVEIKNRFSSYNNLNFVISPCLDEKSGKDMEFSFEKSKFPNSGPKLHAQSPLKDTLESELRAPYNLVQALYKLRFFKLAEANSFRVQVELSSADNMYSTEMIPRKIANFHVLIK